MSKLTKIFGTHSQRELKRIYPIVDKVESYRDQMVALSDEELQAKTKEFKDRLEKGRHWMIYFRRLMRLSVRLRAVSLEWNITEYRSSVVLSCIRDVLLR